MCPVGEGEYQGASLTLRVGVVGRTRVSREPRLRFGLVWSPFWGANATICPNAISNLIQIFAGRL